MSDLTTTTPPTATSTSPAAGTLAPDFRHPLIWLLALVFGSGGAGTVWMSQKNDIDHLGNQLTDLKEKNQALTQSVGSLKKDVEIASAKAQEKDGELRAVRDALAKAQQDANDCAKGSISVDRSSNVAIGKSRVNVGTSHR